MASSAGSAAAVRPGLQPEEVLMQKQGPYWTQHVARPGANLGGGRGVLWPQPWPRPSASPGGRLSNVAS